MADEGMDLIVTTGGLGPTADDLTAEVVGRLRRPRAGRSTRRWRRRSPRSCAASPGASSSTRRRVLEANRKQAMVPEGATALDPVGTAPGLVVPAGERVVVVLPGPAARAAADVAGGAGDGAGSRGARRARRRCTPTRCGCSACPSPKSPRACARSRTEGVGARRRWRSPPACGAARSRSTSATETRRRDCAEAVRAGLAERHPARDLQPRRRDDRRAGRGAARRAHGSAWPSPAAAGCWRRGSPTCPAPPPTWRAASSPTRTRRRPSCSASTRALIEAHGRGLARGRRGDGAWARSSASGPTSRSSITGIAGPDGGSEEKPVGYVCFNARLADGTAIAPRAGHPRQPRRHPRTLGAGRDAPAAHPARRRRGASVARVGDAFLARRRVVSARCSVRSSVAAAMAKER